MSAMTTEVVRRFNGLLKIVEAVPYERPDPKARGLTTKQQIVAQQIDEKWGPVAAERYRVDCRRENNGNA